jgi:hypothetical protein
MCHFVTVKAAHTLKLMVLRVGRRTFEPKWKDVRGGWRKLHGGEVYNLYSC